MPVWCTNRSLPWSSGVMKPKPFSSLNHFTVPVAIGVPSREVCAGEAREVRRATTTRRWHCLRRAGSPGRVPPVYPYRPPRGYARPLVAVEVRDVAPGLWLWRQPHPSWSEGSDWQPEDAYFLVESQGMNVK